MLFLFFYLDHKDQITISRHHRNLTKESRPASPKELENEVDNKSVQTAIMKKHDPGNYVFAIFCLIFYLVIVTPGLKRPTFGAGDTPPKKPEARIVQRRVTT